MSKQKGKVYLVGAGPGNPELISERGLRLLAACDAVVYDHLVSSSLIEKAASAARYCVGKTSNQAARISQRKIDQLLIRLAKQGKKIVRLKGGDPFIFGRGGEEALHLASKRIPFEVVPGITAALAASSYAGIPLTHRNVASSVTFVTAHEDPAKGQSSVDWRALARLKGTLVIYMGMKKFPSLVDCLIQSGFDSQMPIAVIRWASTGNQQTAMGTLASIGSKLSQDPISSPAVAILGDVAKFNRKLSWFESKPLLGKKILVTRPKGQAQELVSKLEELGALAVSLPMIEIEPVRRTAQELKRALNHLAVYDWIVFTSENGVTSFMKHLFLNGSDTRRLSDVKIAAVGPGTEKRLMEFSLRADFVPKTYTAQFLFREMREKGLISGRHFLLVRTSIATEQLRSDIEKAGGRADDVTVYETRMPAQLKAKLQEIVGQGIDYVTFTSASAVKNFFSNLPPHARAKFKSRLISIGPVTSSAIRKEKMKVYREAKPHTIDGLIKAISGEFISV